MPYPHLDCVNIVQLSPARSYYLLPDPYLSTRQAMHDYIGSGCRSGTKKPFDFDKIKRYRADMRVAVLANRAGEIGVPIARSAVMRGLDALEAVEHAIRAVEKSELVHCVGFGGAPNLQGEVECDASIMCGASLRCGSVAALKGHLHAISVARQVMERSPHVMLVGEGAALFASEIGETHTTMLSPRAKDDFETWLRENIPQDILINWPNVPLLPFAWRSAESKAPKGTTCFLARASSSLAGGVSTSGWAYKYPGRVGDSAIIGSGLYVDNRYGACACTHTGEMTIRTNACKTVIDSMKRGASVENAVHEALEELRDLRGGHLGPVVIHAMDRDARPYVASLGLPAPARYWFWEEGMQEIQCIEASAG